MRVKMDQADRAKQFMPFAALKGYEEALRLKEKIVVERVELSDELSEELDRNLRQVKRGDMIEVTYYQEGEYLKMTGLVARIDETSKVLKVVNTKIAFADICQIALV